MREKDLPSTDGSVWLRNRLPMLTYPGAPCQLSARAALVRSLKSWVPMDDPGIALPHLTLQTVTGISVAIAGNVLISLALNLQKLAHLRLAHGRQNGSPDVEWEGGRPGCDTSTMISHSDTAARLGAAQQALEGESQPLVPHRSSSQPPPLSYGLANYNVPVAGDDTRSRKSSNTARSRQQQRKPSFVSRFLPPRSMIGNGSSSSSNYRVDLSDSSSIPVEDVLPGRNTRTSHQGKGKGSARHTVEDGKESDYLHSKLWCATRDFLNL